MDAFKIATMGTYTTQPLKDAFCVKVLLIAALSVVIQTLVKDATPIVSFIMQDAYLFVPLAFILLKLLMDLFVWSALKIVQLVL